jgi:hypothetical protein
MDRIFLAIAAIGLLVLVTTLALAPWPADPTGPEMAQIISQKRPR